MHRALFKYTVSIWLLYRLSPLLVVEIECFDVNISLLRDLNSRISADV